MASTEGEIAPEPSKKKRRSNLAKDGAAENTSKNRATKKEASPPKLDPNSTAAYFIEALKNPACMAALNEKVRNKERTRANRSPLGGRTWANRNPLGANRSPLG